ncbi:MAG: hypothetical protein IJU26_06340 [Synergistaceae bacterium]|nr:hypothetical protein [Synergistaceae bacterium]
MTLREGTDALTAGNRLQHKGISSQESLPELWRWFLFLWGCTLRESVFLFVNVNTSP